MVFVHFLRTLDVKWKKQQTTVLPASYLLKAFRNAFSKSIITVTRRLKICFSIVVRDSTRRSSLTYRTSRLLFRRQYSIGYDTSLATTAWKMYSCVYGATTQLNVPSHLIIGVTDM